MRLKCDVLMTGPGPFEATVAITTADGKEEVVVDTALIHDENKLEVSRILERTKDRALVELPRESASGRWRVWVPRSSLASA